MTPSPDIVERLRELLAKADALPWEVQKDGWTIRVEQKDDTEQARGWRVAMTHHSGPNRVEREVANAELIVAAVNALPELLDEITRLRDELERERVRLAACGVAAPQPAPAVAWWQDFDACPKCHGSFSFSKPIADGKCPHCGYAPQPVADALDEAVKAIYAMTDALRPPPAGSFARGEHEGICAAARAVADMRDKARRVAPQPAPVTELSDADIIAIRDECLPSQGEAFDCVAFARAILAARGKP